MRSLLDSRTRADLIRYACYRDGVSSTNTYRCGLVAARCPVAARTLIVNIEERQQRFAAVIDHALKSGATIFVCDAEISPILLTAIIAKGGLHGPYVV